MVVTPFIFVWYFGQLVAVVYSFGAGERSRGCCVKNNALYTITYCRVDIKRLVTLW